MKVLLVNGSPHAQGATYIALKEVAKSLAAQNIETEIFHLGTKAISGCLGCQYCRTHDKQCVINDVVNDFNKNQKTMMDLFWYPCSLRCRFRRTHFFYGQSFL